MKKILIIIATFVTFILSSCHGYTESYYNQKIDNRILDWDAYDSLNVIGEFQCYTDFGMAKASWGYNDVSIMKPSSLNMVKNIEGIKSGEGREIYSKLKERDLKALYIFEGIECGTKNALSEAGNWLVTAKIDNKFVKLNCSYALSIVACEYNADEDVYYNNYLIEKGSYAEALNDQIDLSFPHSETKDAGGRDWTSLPAIINGPGVYTVVYAEYNSMFKDCHCGLAVVKTTALTEPVNEAYELEQVSLIGAFDNHNWDYDADFAPANEGKWGLTIALEAGDEVKVRINHDWAYTYAFFALTEETTSFCDAGGNFGVLESGLFHFEISFNKPEDLSLDNSLSLFTVALIS